MFEWNSGYMECSAKLGGQGVNQVFTELLQRVRNKGQFCAYHHVFNHQTSQITSKARSCQNSGDYQLNQ